MQEQAAILSAHNIERTKHGVASLYWDYSASDFAESYVSKCPGDIVLLPIGTLESCRQEPVSARGISWVCPQHISICIAGLQKRQVKLLIMRAGRLHTALKVARSALHVGGPMVESAAQLHGMRFLRRDSGRQAAGNVPLFKVPASVAGIAHHRWMPISSNVCFQE